MGKTNDGGPAFPLPWRARTEGLDHFIVLIAANGCRVPGLELFDWDVAESILASVNGQTADPNMSLRDYFAAQAIAGSGDRLEELTPDECKVIAENAYKIADAMLAEREGQDES